MAAADRPRDCRRLWLRTGTIIALICFFLLLVLFGRQPYRRLFPARDGSLVWTHTIDGNRKPSRAPADKPAQMMSTKQARTNSSTKLPIRRPEEAVFYPTSGPAAPTAGSADWLPVPPLPPLPPDGCVFLLETSGRQELTARECCAVESAARAHPRHLVVLLVSAPRLRRSPLVASLLTLNNTRVARLDFAALMAGTPLETWYRSRAVLRSRWPAVHMSDALRLVLLLRFGGIYLDTDVIVQRSMAALADGAGLQNAAEICNAVLKFGRASSLPGRLTAEFAGGYNPASWGHNGPILLTRVMMSGCGLHQLPANGTHCGQYTIFDRWHFYPVPWPEWHRLLDTAVGGEVLRLVADSHVIHMWGKFARRKLVLARSATHALAERHCPLAVRHAAHNQL